jgi:hypothetical protein
LRRPEAQEAYERTYQAEEYAPKTTSPVKVILAICGTSLLIAGALFAAYRFGSQKESERMARVQETLTETAAPLAPQSPPPPVQSIVEAPPAAPMTAPAPVTAPALAPAPAPLPVVLPPPLPVPPPVIVPVARISASELAALLTRGKSAIADGDISLARSMLERASLAEDAQAFFLLAETYDANRLKAWGARGVRPDSVRARSLYEKADAAGEPLAKERLAALK